MLLANPSPIPTVTFLATVENKDNGIITASVLQSNLIMSDEYAAPPPARLEQRDEPWPLKYTLNRNIQVDDTSTPTPTPVYTPSLSTPTPSASFPSSATAPAGLAQATPGNTAQSATSASAADTTNSKLSTGALAGIVIGVVVAFLVLALFFLGRGRRNGNPNSASAETGNASSIAPPKSTSSGPNVNASLGSSLAAPVSGSLAGAGATMPVQELNSHITTAETQLGPSIAENSNVTSIAAESQYSGDFMQVSNLGTEGLAAVSGIGGASDVNGTDVVVGAAIVGAAALGGIAVSSTSRNSLDRHRLSMEEGSDTSANFVPPPPDDFVVKQRFEATKSDEIDLFEGDLIGVRHRFNDGYAYGRNTNTKKWGVFPTAAVTYMKTGPTQTISSVNRVWVRALNKQASEDDVIASASLFGMRNDSFGAETPSSFNLKLRGYLASEAASGSAGTTT